MGFESKSTTTRAQALQSAYMDAMQPKGIKCPHCGEHILTLVRNPKTGKMDACPACGQAVK